PTLQPPLETLRLDRYGRLHLPKTRQTMFATFWDATLADHAGIASHRRGDSHLPETAELKTASMTAMFAMESSTGTGTCVSSRTALEKASPCSVYWSQAGKVSVAIPPPERSPVASMKMRVGRSGGALTGISISMRPRVPRKWMRWYGINCVLQVKMEW